MRGLLILGSIVMVAASAVRSEDNLTKCADTLGVSRVAEVDTTGGALFGDQYPPTTLLQKGEVVLTFDDGPHPTYTKQIEALAAQCTKATFFNVGEMVKQYPDVAREVEAEGHTIGTDTWSHPNRGLCHWRPRRNRSRALSASRIRPSTTKLHHSFGSPT